VSRRLAQISEADARRIIRAAKKEGASEVVLQVGEVKATIRLSTVGQKTVEQNEEIVL
jgi:hypothetical protein